jgi:hypothetical protein
VRLDPRWRARARQPNVLGGGKAAAETGQEKRGNECPHRADLEPDYGIYPVTKPLRRAARPLT